ncbi:BRO1-domain-containing protein [Basidiobolus meristosporus CBS 931.73]|uniref:BRO domain-containing protein 1 n=1 Tax=Basidiobolus meristosporus CBS 931.73 TaxID=1314790 RepID=A0A1Y1Y617_9FUNG|nr:BRO1-domain-containing protein [Basidiobolus meristosporus CBS 931.73]|eukprot:ORX93428.1 BRO1-domain-containing protein [Basidiobolus meristosporus CBS 931.73]
MIQSPCIHVPSKRTEEVDWATPLKKYIASNYQDDPEKYLEEVNTINKLRQDMRGAGKDTTGRDLLYRYYGQLELLDLRFPVDENNIKISFTWCDSFTGKATSQFSLAYEKACTIFNMASTLSAIASSQARSDPEGLKQAFNNFQASAGMFTYINENFLHAPSTDLSRDIVKILSQLMLSQAQECFLEKSLSEKKKDALLAKLASQASWSYGSIVDAMNEGVAKTALSRWWYTLCQMVMAKEIIVQAKQKHYQAMAQYQKALACEAENKYGEVVARLTYAETNAKEAVKLANTFANGFTPSLTSIPPDAATALQDITKSSQTIISEKLLSATKDNDLVYHDTIPNVDVLQPIDKLNAVKPIPISELYGPNEIQKVIGVDIFQRLIPLSVHESASLYSEEKSKILRKETEKVDLANGELDAALSFMQLPQSIEKFKNSNSNGDKFISSLAQSTPEVKEWARMISQEENERGMVGELVATLEGLRGKAKEILDDVTVSLDQEQRDHEAMRVKFGDLWTQTSSSTLTASFRQDIRTHREALDKAITSDRSLISRFEELHASIEVLRQGEHSDRLEQMFAEAVSSATGSGSGRGVNSVESSLPDNGADNGIEDNIVNIENCIERLRQFRKERQETLDDLKNKIQDDDISHLLILNKKSPNVESQLFATELEKFKGHQNRIAVTVQHQQATVQELSGYFKALMEGAEAKRVQRIWDNAEAKRDEVINKLRLAANGYLDIKNGVRKGIQFYADLHDILMDLNASARRMVYDREQERQSLLQSIEGNQTERGHQALREQLEKHQDVPRNRDQRRFENPSMNPAETNMYADAAIQKLNDQVNRLNIHNERSQTSYATAPGPQVPYNHPPMQAPIPNQVPTRYSNQSDYSSNSPTFSPPPNALGANMAQNPVCKTPSYGSDKEQNAYYPPPQNVHAPMARTPSYGSETDHHNSYLPPVNQNPPPMNAAYGPAGQPNMIPGGYQPSPYANQDPQARGPRQPAPQHPHANIQSPDIVEPRQPSPVIDRNAQTPIGVYQGQYTYGQSPYQQQQPQHQQPSMQAAQPQNYSGAAGYGYPQQQTQVQENLTSPQANTHGWQPQQQYQKNLPPRQEYNPSPPQPVQQQYPNQNPQPNQYPGYGGSALIPAQGQPGLQRQPSNYDLQLKQSPQGQQMNPAGQPIRSPPPQQPQYQGFDNQAAPRPDPQQYYDPRTQQSQYNPALQQQSFQQPPQQHARPNMYHEGSQNSHPQYTYGNGPTAQVVSSPYQPPNPATVSGGSDNSYVSTSQIPPQQGYQPQQVQYQQYHGQPQNQQPTQDPRLREAPIGQQQQQYAYQGRPTGQVVQQPPQYQQQLQQQQQEHNYANYPQRHAQGYEIPAQQYQPSNPQQQFQTAPNPHGYQPQVYNPSPPQGPSGYVNPPPQGWQQGTSPQQLVGNQYQPQAVTQGQQLPPPQQQYHQQPPPHLDQWNGYPQQQRPPQGNF